MSGAAGGQAARVAAATTDAWCDASAVRTAERVAQSSGHAPAWAEVWARGEARLRKLGWPTPRHADWRHTSLTHLRPVAEDGMVGEAQLDAATSEAVREHLAASRLPGPRLVFINGRLAGELSYLGADRTVELRPWDGGSQPPARLDALGGGAPRPFAALNSALMGDGASLRFSGSMPAGEVVQLTFIAVPQAGAVHAHPRLIVEAQAGSRAIVMEEHVALAGEVRPQLTNLLTECFVAEGAELSYTTLHQGQHAVVNQFLATVGRRAHLEAAVLALGASWTRHELHIQLAGEAASVDLVGASVGRERQHHDQQICIHHQAAKTRSSQDFRGCYADHSVGVFVGKVNVEAGGAGSRAKQMSRSILVGPHAAAHSQPHMEILHDDVQCSHGATVGQLDEAALFFLTSRGLPPAEAQMLMTYGFLAEIAQKSGSEAVQARADTCLRALFDLPEAARGGWASAAQVAP